ncbi:MAG: ABC transporter permease [Candidatus Wallbacteria bacterium]|nr:ABC transporter permease [Candidatus Wallbacteria bacterium]
MKALLAEVWQRRALVGSLWKGDVLGRYANSAAGLLWAVFAPMGLIAVYVLLFSALLPSKVVGAGAVAGGFGFFVFAGMIPWLVVAGAAQNAPGCLLAHGATLRRFAIPPSVVPAAVVLSALTDAAVAGTLFGLALGASGRLAPLKLLALAPLAVFLVAMVYGLSLAVSALNLYGRDVAHAVSAALPFWFFATPVCYPAEALPAGLGWVLALNPMDGFVQAARWALIGSPVPGAAALAWSAVASLAALAAGAWVFQETRGDFADLL